MTLLSLVFILFYLMFASLSLFLFNEGIAKSIGIGDTIFQVILGTVMAIFAYGFLVLAYGVG